MCTVEQEHQESEGTTQQDDANESNRLLRLEQQHLKQLYTCQMEHEQKRETEGTVVSLFTRIFMWLTKKCK